MDGWFHFFSSQGLGKSEVTSILLTEARICLYTVFIRISAQPRIIAQPRISAHHHSLPPPNQTQISTHPHPTHLSDNEIEIEIE